jgi:hypothetical protein
LATKSEAIEVDSYVILLTAFLQRPTQEASRESGKEDESFRKRQRVLTEYLPNFMSDSELSSIPSDDDSGLQVTTGNDLVLSSASHTGKNGVYKIRAPVIEISSSDEEDTNCRETTTHTVAVDNNLENESRSRNGAQASAVESSRTGLSGSSETPLVGETLFSDHGVSEIPTAEASVLQTKPIAITSLGVETERTHIDLDRGEGTSAGPSTCMVQVEGIVRGKEASKLGSVAPQESAMTRETSPTTKKQAEDGTDIPIRPKVSIFF